MRPYHVEASGMGQFLTALRERETLLNNPHRGKPVLYLKCWGSDYPYLQGVEPQERWLPVVVKSPSNI